jgi:uncharacterized protein (DUF2147 family)
VTVTFPYLQRATAAIAFAATISSPAFADPVGLWRSSDGGTTRIAPCGAALCGYVASINPSTDPETGRPRTDKNNLDASKRSRPLIGVPVLIGMRPDSSGRWTGQLYDIGRGQVFTGRLTELNQSTVRVEGCMLGICGGENMTRVK